MATNYTWDEDNILYETDDSDVVTAKYTYNPEQYGELICERRDSHTYAHHYDAQGSTMAITDESQHIIHTVMYDGWGNELCTTGTTISAFRWIGRFGYYSDTFSNEMSIRRRQYAPLLGRWLSQDEPYAFDDQYSYVMNRPVILTDPSGLAPLCVKCDADPKFDCGNFEWFATFQKAGAGPGWLIQKVTVTLDSIKCETKERTRTQKCKSPPAYTNAAGVADTLEYWEAWYLTKSGVMKPLVKNPDGTFGIGVRNVGSFDDRFGFGRGGAGTKGRISASGTVYFIPGAVKEGIPGGNNIWDVQAKAGDSLSGFAPYSCTGPKIAAGTESAIHSIAGKWDCCKKPPKSEREKPIIEPKC